jgi:hypothetical protein
VRHQLAKLAATARLTDGAVHTYFTLTVASAPYTECRNSWPINARPLSSRGGSLARPRVEPGRASPDFSCSLRVLVGSGVAGSASTTGCPATGESNRYLPNKPSEPIRH